MRKVRGSYEAISYTDLLEKVEAFAAGLYKMGVVKGDVIGIVSENRLEWVVADMAIAGLGAVDVPVFPTLTAKQEEFIFHHCNARVIIVSNRFQFTKILKVRDSLPALKHIIIMNDDVDTDDSMVRRFSVVAEEGREHMSADQRRMWFARQCEDVQPSDLLTIIYTSGTTGEPKGVMLTHANLVANVQGASEAIKITPKDVILSYLPLCHSYERAAGYYTVFACGATIAFAESIETVVENLKEVHPTVMTSVPRLFERIRNRVLAEVEKETPSKQKIFRWAFDIGKEYYKTAQAGHVPTSLKLKNTLADKLVFGKIRERMGGRLRLFVSGGAALPLEVGEFFLSAGLKIIEGYGLTEASPCIAVNRVEDIQLGTVGRPLFNVQVRIADDGEILVRGDNVMKGYLNSDSATREVIDGEGWLHTGDIGILTKSGHLKITDRKKDILVSSGGKNIAPQPIENALSQSRYIDQMVLIGDRREYCTALLVPDFDAVRVYADEKGLLYSSNSDLAANSEVHREIQRDINRLQSDFSKYEKVRKFALLSEPFSVENGDMTPTLKVKRHIVERKYAGLIDALYAGDEE